MIWDQILSSWDCDVNSGADSIQNHCVGHGLVPTHPSNWRWLPRFCVLCQWLFATWLLSTWLGDWLASQSPNPSWHHRLSTETIVKYSNSVSSCALCCNGVSAGWLGVWLQIHASYQCSEVRNQQNHMVFFRKLLVWVLECQNLRPLILPTKISEVCSGTFCLVGVNLVLVKIDKGFAWKILDNQTAKLDSTSWD